MEGNLKTPPLTGQSTMNDLKKQAERVKMLNSYMKVCTQKNCYIRIT